MGTTVYSSGNTLKPVADAVAGLFSVVTGITAYAGGGQGSATQLTGALNSVDTVATAAGKTATYHCTVGGTGGKWFRDLSA